MGKIHMLGQHTIDQIAAGEVIDRPVSVVKELTENAIDAGATAITIEIKDGGSGLIRVTDNGGGILREDLQIAFKRHATSKIGDANDLLTVASLGFRGEALSSISAVSRVELITRTHTALVGSRYVIEGGSECTLEEVGAPEGTTIIVRDLFYNTPARKKFLKSAQTEGSHISDMVSKMALSRPDISFRFIMNGQNKFHTSGNHNLKDVIYQIYGRDIARELLPLEVDGSFFQLHGYLGKPMIARGNRNYEIYFINGRYIKSSLIAKAVEEGYRNFLMQHKFPLCVFNLVIDPEFTDVNVHPAKMEIRFRNQQYLFEELTHAVRKCLTTGELSPKIELSAGKLPGSYPAKKAETAYTAEPAKSKETVYNPQHIQKREAANFANSSEPLCTTKSVKATESANSDKSGTSAETVYTAETQKISKSEYIAEPAKKEEKPRQPVYEPFEINRRQQILKEAELHLLEQEANGKGNALEEVIPKEVHQQNLFEEKLLRVDTLSQVKLVGQIFDTYWIAEYEDTFMLIDQHAAHEKVNYERIIKELKDRSYSTQGMQPPKVITLSVAMQDSYEQAKKIIADMGFEIEPFGGNEYAIYGMPDNLVGIEPEELLEQLLTLGEDAKRITMDAVYERAATMACKASIKGNQRLSPVEAEKLIADLVTLENPYTCPHGRPTMIRMTQKELEKKFKRIL